MFTPTSLKDKLFGINESKSKISTKIDTGTIESYTKWYQNNGTQLNINENATALRKYCTITEGLGDKGYFRLGFQLGMWNRNNIPAQGKPYVRDLIGTGGK